MQLNTRASSFSPPVKSDHRGRDRTRDIWVSSRTPPLPLGESSYANTAYTVAPVGTEHDWPDFETAHNERTQEPALKDGARSVSRR